MALENLLSIPPIETHIKYLQRCASIRFHKLHKDSSVVARLPPQWRNNTFAKYMPPIPFISDGKHQSILHQITALTTHKGLKEWKQWIPWMPTLKTHDRVIPII